MTSLLDIGDLTRVIQVGNAKLTVRGVTPEGFFYLLSKFPALQELFVRGRTSLSMADIVEVAPDCIAFIIAVVTTDRMAFETPAEWKAKVEEMAVLASRITIDKQAILFDAAVELTFSDGVGPFMEAMGKLAKFFNRETGKTAPATTSSKPSRTGFTVDGSRGMKLGKGAPIKSLRH